MFKEKDVFLFAIRREIEAHQIYKRLSEVVDSEDVKVLFLSLSNDELLHKDSIERLYREMFGSEPLDISADIKIELPARFKRSYALEVLDSAMEKEREASENYNRLADQSDKEDIKRLFRRFADMEKGHFELLQAEKQRIIDGYYWFTQNEDRSLED
jgi:rubrerythrin